MVNFLMIDDNPVEHLIMQRLFDKFHLFPGARHSTDARLSMNLITNGGITTGTLPDVIFLDLNMPGFSGWDFLEEFNLLYKKMKKPVDVYIISSSINPEDRQLVNKYDFVKAMISKPIKVETLLNLYSLYQMARRAAS